MRKERHFVAASVAPGSLFSEEECPVDTKFLRKCVDSIMKLDQKSKSKVKIERCIHAFSGPELH